MAVHRVVAVPLDGVRVLDLAAPAHFFGHLGEGRYSFATASLEPGPVPTSSGFAVSADAGAEAIAAAETVVVPGYAAVQERPPGALLELLRDAAARGARVMSVCTGAFALAHAGLLDGRRATTHWADTGLLASLFPEVEVDAGVLFVDEGRVLTSAGVAAGLDLCLHVVRRDHGAEVAASFARRSVVAPHRDGGQAQFIERPLPPAEDRGADLAATRAWALERLDRQLNVATLARHALVSPRTFARRFRAETGTTPHRWLLQQRLLRARRMLEGSQASVEEVASSCGFGSAASLRAHFRRHTGTTPTAYRNAFAAETT
jgi:AraC family transcriptional activator FtrA